jgi:hypothetical protein
MTAGDIGYNVAIAASIVGIGVSVTRYSTVSLIAAAIACGAVTFDFLSGPPRGFVGLNRESWSWLAFAGGGIADDNQFYFTRLGMLGTNVAKEELALDDAYFSSGITGAQVHLKVQMPVKVVSIKEINPIPPSVNVGLIMDINPPIGLNADDLLKLWGPFSFVVSYGGKKQKIDFTREQTIELVTRKSEAWPYVTLRSSVEN